ncbi:MAG: DUF3800 domain-containing protein [Rhodobacteraceae bacterium]|nr:DUF3800 domain-containing protein [Paracoccaceae bacterium]
MTHSFIAFIDEAGDDGLAKYREPGKRGGASSWLVLSACVFRATLGLEGVQWRDEINSLMPDRRKRELHFKELNHGQRLAASRVLAAKPVRILSVMAAKRPIPEGLYAGKNLLYFYMARYLVERLSWLCRDMRPRVPEGDGRVAITFSRRGGMSYDSFREYLERLRRDQEHDIRVHWPVIDIDAVDAQDHGKSASLQLVDIAASAFASAVEPDYYGNFEPRYAEILKPVTYSREGKFLCYGVKLVPSAERCGLIGDQTKLLEIFG